MAATHGPSVLLANLTSWLSPAQKLPNPGLQPRAAGGQRLALPNHQHAPAGPPQRPRDALVPGHVALQLRRPIAPPNRGNPAPPATVHVPEAAADENGFAQTGENQVGSAGEGADVEAVAEAEGVDEAADGHFGGGVFGFDRGHDAGTGCFREGVGHWENFTAPSLGAKRHCGKRGT